MRELTTPEEKADALRRTVLRDFEQACNAVAIVFGESEQRRVAIEARGKMRVANGEAAT